MGTTFTGGDLKLAADQTITTISETLLATKAFSIEVDATGLGEGDSVQVFVPGDSDDDKEDYDDEENNYMHDNGGKHAWVPVLLDTHKKQTTFIKPKAYRKLTTSGLAGIYKKLLIKLCASIIAVPFKLITATNFPTEYDVKLKKDFNKSTTGEIETALVDAVGEGSGRNLILNLDYFDALRDSLTVLYGNPAGIEALSRGTIPGVSGFTDVIRTSVLEKVGATKKKYLVGLATNQTGIAMSFGNCEPPDAFNGELTTAIEPITGIPIQFSVDYDAGTRAHVATVEALFGCKVIEKKGIVRLITEVK